MNLHDHMDRATEGMSSDLDRLSRAAQHEGTRLRRRRHGFMAVGAAAAVATVAATTFAVTSIGSADDTQRAETGATKSSNAAPGNSKTITTVPLNGRSTVAALEDAIKQVADGSFDEYRGQGDATTPDFPDTYGGLRFTPADDSGFGHVGINIQGGDLIKQLGTFRCDGSFMLDCTARTLPNGDRLRTYRDRPDGDGDVRQVAELWADGDTVRVVASADNGTDLGSNNWNIERPDSVLTKKQLTDIVTQDYWGVEIPERFDKAGQQLSPYDDLDDTADPDDTEQPPGGQPLQPSPSR